MNTRHHIFQYVIMTLENLNIDYCLKFCRKIAWENLIGHLLVINESMITE